jgi:hypothetical protein
MHAPNDLATCLKILGLFKKGCDYKSLEVVIRETRDVHDRRCPDLEVV